MKIAGTDREIERIGVVVETPFRVKGTAKAFRILSSGLYRDKIRAIVRELSCNAFDAHVEAGRADRPFDIHLPNILEPVFRIRDYGLGLSHDDLTTIYTTYFESTKTGSNDLIGGLGLGSKAPFSYVDSFTVTSRHKGEKRSYTLFISDDGCPVVAQMGETEVTDEESGLEVIIPVDKASDFAEFAKKAATVLAYFNPAPSVHGVASFKIERPDVVLEGVGFRVMASGGPVAVMGRIGYPISVNDMRFFSFENAGFQKAARDLLSTNIEIDFPIGSLDITAGREELSYDKATVQAIGEAINRVYRDLREIVQVQFDACQTEVEARRLYGRFQNASDIFYTLAQADKFAWTAPNGSVVPIDTSLLRLANQTTTHLKLATLRLNSRGNPGRPAWMMIPPKGSVVFDSTAIFYLDDLPKGGVSRAQSHWRQNKTPSAYLIPNDPDLLDTLKTAFDGLILTPTSTLPRVVDPRPRSKVKFRQFVDTRLAKPDTVQVDVDVDDASKIRFYVLYREGTYYTGEGDGMSRDALLARWGCRSDLGLGDAQNALYLVPSSLAKKVAGKAHWQPVLPLLKERAETRFAELINDPLYLRYRSVSDLKAARSDVETFMGVFRNSRLPQHHPIMLLTTTLTQCRSAPSSLTAAIDRLSGKFGLSLAATRDQRLIDAFDAIMARYPMIEVLIRGYGFRGDGMVTARCEDYVDLIDRYTFEVKSEAA